MEAAHPPFVPHFMPVVSRQPLASLPLQPTAISADVAASTKRKRALDGNAAAGSGMASDGSSECLKSGCSCQQEIQGLKEHIKTLNSQLEARMHGYVEDQLQALTAQLEAKIEAAADRPAKKPKKAKQGRCCFVCGGQEGSVLNRQLGVVLDDRCRKQVDVIKHGGKLTERKELWERAIAHVQAPAARTIAQKLGVGMLDPAAHRVASCSEKLAGELCAVCQEPMMLGARVQTLECGSQHTFHHECIGWWLVESATCPLCREDLSENGVKAPDSGFGRNPTTLPSSCSDVDFPEDFEMMMDLLQQDTSDGACSHVMDWGLPPDAIEGPEHPRASCAEEQAQCLSLCAGGGGCG
eukprot:TRINITY_DN62_c0_g1_i1.p1 TRINITY_DN62_c0_g1~~TRINITY_DN62_c0_g1_i1.p1  ORF type:complete len:353 (-),score=49.95 TRINITY_DN62_c0_g1_i1:405-1463(-)